MATMDRFEDLNNLVTIIETGGITAAADRLDLSKSVVSRRLKQLEKRLGTQMIVRTTRTQRVTNEGQMFYERAKQILADLEEAETALIPQTAALTGSLRLTAPIHFGVNFVVPNLMDFISAHKDLVIDIELIDQHVNLVEEGFDLAIRIGALPDSSLIVRKLLFVDTKACASPSYVELYGSPVAPDQLENFHGLYHRSGANLTEWSYVDRGGEHCRTRLPARVISNDDHVLLSAAIAGLGIIWVPAFIVKEAIAKGQLVEVLPDVNWHGHNAYAVYPPTRHLSNRVRACVDFLVTRFS